jgi:uncharacterized membrane protein
MSFSNNHLPKIKMLGKNRSIYLQNNTNSIIKMGNYEARHRQASEILTKRKINIRDLWCHIISLIN